MKEIVIDIDQNGNCSVDGKGFVGAECQKFIGEIQKTIGCVRSKKIKQEYNITERAPQNRRLERGR